MMFTLENKFLRIRVDQLGAELKGLYSKEQKREYLWQPGHEIWDHSSLILFPNPARICRDRAIIGGEVYPATMHGFAYKSEFEVESQTGSCLELVLRASEETRRYFPYAFRLHVVFRLEGRVLVQQFRVTTEDEEMMYFSLGAHPGFYLPLVLGESGNDYILHFDRPQNLHQLELQKGTSLLTGKRTMYLENSSDIPLREDFFNNGSVLLSGMKADCITLKSEKSGHYMKMGIQNFPYMCLWGNPYKNAMICIEPWCGVSDLADTDHVWEKKLGIESVKPGEQFIRTLSFEVG